MFWPWPTHFFLKIPAYFTLSTYHLLCTLCVSSEFFWWRSQQCRSQAEESERPCDNSKLLPVDKDPSSVAFPYFCGVKLLSWPTKTGRTLTPDFWISGGPILPFSFSPRHICHSQLSSTGHQLEIQVSWIFIRSLLPSTHLFLSRWCNFTLTVCSVYWSLLFLNSFQYQAIAPSPVVLSCPSLQTEKCFNRGLREFHAEGLCGKDQPIT